jgi:hypothetical protein
MMDADRMAACLGKPVSSTIHALIGPCRSIFGTTSSRTLASTRSSDQRSLADEMQQLLMLHRNPARRRHRRHRLNALAALRRQQPGAIIAQRRRRSACPITPVSSSI